MHIGQNEPHNHSKLCLQLEPPPPLPPNPTQPPLKLFRPILYKLTPPWGSNQKTNIHMYLKIPFQVGFVLHKIAKFSKNTPFQPHSFNTHFCLPRQILSKMVWHNPTKLQCYHISGKIPGKGTTHPKVTDTNLATPESFIPIDPSNEKLINNLISTEKMLTTWPPGTPRGASNQKTKKYLSLKIYFRRGTFNK